MSNMQFFFKIPVASLQIKESVFCLAPHPHKNESEDFLYWECTVPQYSVLSVKCTVHSANA